MRAKTLLFCFAAAAMLALPVAEPSFAQQSNPWARGNSWSKGNSWSRGNSWGRENSWSRENPWSRGPSPKGDKSETGRGNSNGDFIGAYGGRVRPVLPGIIMAIPSMIPEGGDFIDDDGAIPDGVRAPRPPRRQAASRRGPSGAPAANERRLVPDEVVIELRNTVTPQQINALQTRHRLTRLESQVSQLSGTTLYRWRIPDRRSVRNVVRALEADNAVASAQPNYKFALQQNDTKSAGDPAQYELAKLRLPQAHALSRGGNVRVAVIDSGVDIQHPDLAGAIAGTFDALATPKSAPMTPHSHGTAIAGLIAARGKLLGAAPEAQILAVHACDPDGKNAAADGTTFAILKGLDWAAAQGARVINMSFAGPNDPAIRRSLEAAHKKGIVLIAAAGNAGAKSPPLFPAADANVIAVTATDAGDKLFEQSNRGKHIAVAAPGKEIFVAIPDGGYERSSGTSYSAAEVSGIVALMLARNGTLTPDRVRSILMSTARDLGAKGRDSLYGAGLADAFAALSTESVPVAAVPLPVERVSSGAR